MTVRRHAPHADLQARLAATRRVLRDRGISGAIIMGPAAQYWLCGLDTFLGALIPQALIFAMDGGEPILVVWDADAPLARQTSVLSDVRTFRFGVDEPPALFAQLAASAAPSPARIGTDLSSRAIPFAFGNALSRALGGRDLVDITLDLAKLRAVKSPAEIALMRIAGSYDRRGLEAARRHAQPGTTELGLAAEVDDVGTTFVLHACLLDERASIGVLVGATYVITGDGYEMLSGAGDVELT
jgi:Xaa-Pro dipeptidase